MVDGVDYRPCGKCRELVPSTVGCRHWHPEVVKTRNRAPGGRQRENDRARERRALARAIQRGEVT